MMSLSQPATCDSNCRVPSCMPYLAPSPSAVRVYATSSGSSWSSDCLHFVLPDIIFAYPPSFSIRISCEATDGAIKLRVYDPGTPSKEVALSISSPTLLFFTGGRARLVQNNHNKELINSASTGVTAQQVAANCSSFLLCQIRDIPQPLSAAHLFASASYYEENGFRLCNSCISIPPAH